MICTVPAFRGWCYSAVGVGIHGTIPWVVPLNESLWHRDIIVILGPGHACVTIALISVEIALIGVKMALISVEIALVSVEIALIGVKMALISVIIALISV
jgi:hypothetical protein